MIELLTVALVYLGSSLLYASSRTRGTPRLAFFANGTRIIMARIVAAGCALWSFLIWRGLEPGGPAAFLVTLTGLMVTGTLNTLIAPAAPRVAWTLSGLSAAAIPLLALVGELP